MDNAYSLIQRARFARQSASQPAPQQRMDMDKWAAWQSAPTPDLPGYDLQDVFAAPARDGALMLSPESPRATQPGVPVSDVRNAPLQPPRQYVSMYAPNQFEGAQSGAPYNNLPGMADMAAPQASQVPFASTNANLNNVPPSSQSMQVPGVQPQYQPQFSQASPPPPPQQPLPPEPAPLPKRTYTLYNDIVKKHERVFHGNT